MIVLQSISLAHAAEPSKDARDFMVTATHIMHLALMRRMLLVMAGVER